MSNKEIIELKPATEIIKLKPNIEKFCNIYAVTGIGTTAYCEAYGIDRTDTMQYMSAASSATKLLKNPKVCNRINQLIEKTLNKTTLDTQLAFLVDQHEDKKTKLQAIKHANELLKRTGQTNNTFSGNVFNLTQMLDKANSPD